MTQLDSTANIFLLRHVFQFTISVLSDRLGSSSLCAAAESIRWQWPFARILVLGRIPVAMRDQLYDDVAAHSVDENTLLAAIDKLAADPRGHRGGLLQVSPEGPAGPFHGEPALESDPRNSRSCFRGNLTRAVFRRTSADRNG